MIRVKTVYRPEDVDSYLADLKGDGYEVKDVRVKPGRDGRGYNFVVTAHCGDNARPQQLTAAKAKKSDRDDAIIDAGIASVCLLAAIVLIALAGYFWYMGGPYAGYLVALLLVLGGALGFLAFSIVSDLYRRLRSRSAAR